MVTAPEGTTYPYMQAITDILQITCTIRCRNAILYLPVHRPEAPISAQPRIQLVDPDERTRSQEEIANDLQRKLNQFNEARIFAVQEQTIAVGQGSRGGLPVQFILQNQDLK